jgi:hypothetical protein
MENVGVELTLTDEQRQKATIFSAGLALAAFANNQPHLPWGAVDYAIRSALVEMGSDPKSDSWATDYLEYVIFLLTSGGEEKPEPNTTLFTKTLSDFVSLGVASTLNLRAMPDVAVLPPEDENFGVPPEWTKDSTSD